MKITIKAINYIILFLCVVFIVCLRDSFLFLLIYSFIGFLIMFFGVLRIIISKKLKKNTHFFIIIFILLLLINIIASNWCDIYQLDYVENIINKVILSIQGIIPLTWLFYSLLWNVNSKNSK